MLTPVQAWACTQGAQASGRWARTTSLPALTGLVRWGRGTVPMWTCRMPFDDAHVPHVSRNCPRWARVSRVQAWWCTRTRKRGGGGSAPGWTQRCLWTPAARWTWRWTRRCVARAGSGSGQGMPTRYFYSPMQRQASTPVLFSLSPQTSNLVSCTSFSHLQPSILVGTKEVIVNHGRR